MIDILRDLVRSTNGLNFEVIKVTANAGETTFEALNNDRTAIMKATAKNPLPGVEGVFGLCNLAVLQGILGLSAMNAEGASVTVVTNKAGEPEELVFKGKGNKTVYRLMAERSVPKQPVFKVPAYDVSVEPTKGAFIDFKEQSGVFGAVGGNKFTPSVVDGELMLEIGDGGSNHNTKFAFADCGGVLAAGYKYQIPHMITVLSLVASADVVLNLSSKGVMQFTVDTGMLDISFIFPGHS